jgi:IS30 family transposase
VTKGKPWTNSEVKRLQELRVEGKTVAEIAMHMNKSEGAIKQKLRRLGLKVVTAEKHGATTTSELIIPEELISVEEALKELVAAMNALKKPELSRTEVMRLRTLIQTSNLYQKRFAEYMQYREIERQVVELQAKYEQLAEEGD